MPQRPTTEFKVEFWTDASGAPRKHRARHYPSVENMLRAGARWEAKGSQYHCRYWHGLNTWQSATRSGVEHLAPPAPPVRRGGRSPKTKIYSIFGQCEAVAAEIMIKRGEATLIPKEQIPDLPECQYNEHGDSVRFAIILPVHLDHAFNELIKDIRA